MYDLIIIGGGPGAVAAGVYAARKKLKTLLITDNFGGQSLVSADIQNWIGAKSISGLDLAQALEEHLRAQDGIEIVDSDRVISAVKIGGGFRVDTKNGGNYASRTLLLSTGSRRRRLGVPGEDRLDGKGVAYCSTCDAPLFKDKEVAVAGGGNAGLEAAVDLLPYASKVFILERGEELRGDAVTQQKLRGNSKVIMMLNTEIVEILGGSLVSGVRLKDLQNGEIKELPLGGVFVEIGSVPNSDFVKDLVALNKFGEIVADPKTQASSLSGIWAVGDVSNGLYKQNNIAAGDAIKAVLNIGEYLQVR